ncbi:MAG: DNA mismatch repair endonuclease MutL [Treponema sp.]|nr:DNA mismatch repair endonuclease MutL [Treponema sp.]
MSATKPVRKLNAETARKIAAGEVIDRPNAIVRELMDNAVDSGANSITVEVNGGGVEKIRIVDNGSGMTREDLETCAHPHCTSKIEKDVDLLNLTTLGFRGEALASIAAVSRLSIISAGWKMRASITEDHIIEPFAETNGTIVQSEGLFENFPARRQFLKRPASEGLLCKNTFIEKVLPRPDISFRLIMDGTTKLDLPRGVSLTERFVRAMGFRESEKLFYEINSHDTDGKWSVKIILGEPGVNRSNKKDIYIFVNGRKIQEYSLVQAVEYGGQGFFPNGTFPVAAVFVEMDPSEVDFNIHPAKKEARFSDISSLHHGISTCVRNFYKSHTIAGLASNALSTESKGSDTKQKELFEKLFEPAAKTSAPVTSNSKNEDFVSNLSHSAPTSSGVYRGAYKIPTHEPPAESTESPKLKLNDSEIKSSKPEGRSRLDFFTSKISTGTLGNKTSTITAKATPAGNTFESISYKDPLPATETGSSLADSALEEETPSSDDTFRFLGCTLGTFLVAEKNGSLYIIDQHAAHERILFNRIMKEKPNKISLIIPYILETEDDDENKYLESIKNEMSECGFEIEKSGKNTWEVNTTPDRWKGTEKDLHDAILSKRLEPSEIIRSIAAMTACRSAVMDGHVLDEITASHLAKDALNLEDPHCPHGRPVYTELSREKLFMLVKRT